jgi:DNA-binding SARP family transcriptional activator
MEFGVLGPLTVRDGVPVAIPRGKPTAVLFSLLLHRNEVVSSERLIDEVWGETAPRTANKTLQLYVSQLRKVLPSGMLATQPGAGYILHVSDDEIDAGRFERLLAAGRDLLEQGEAPKAAETLRAALALWRGKALAEVAYDDFAQAESERLNGLRLEALEARIEADLALGRHTAVVGDLERLSQEHPLREHLLALYMLALYRCGRQADALEAYRTGRRRLLELGIEPSSELRGLEQQILRQDHSLAAPPRRRAGIAVTSRRTRISLAGVVAVVVAAVTAALVFGLGSGAGRRLADANSVALVGPNGHITTELPVGDSPAHATVGGVFLWTSNGARRHGLPCRRSRPELRHDRGGAQPGGAGVRRRASLGRARARRGGTGRRGRSARRQGGGSRAGWERSHRDRRQGT